MEPKILGIPLSSWFKYHAPNEERQQKHEIINNICADLARNQSKDSYEWKESVEAACTKLLTVLEKPDAESIKTILEWVGEAAEKLALEFNVPRRLMYIQQIRMFYNQAVTFESLIH